jgi:hypothetical protein
MGKLRLLILALLGCQALDAAPVLLNPGFEAGLKD